MANTAHALVCWKCGGSLGELTLPFRRLEVCKACAAELHVCRMCVDYDLAVAKHCREPIAEEVRDKEHANFCDCYKPRPDAYVPRNQAEIDRAKDGLAALFGSAKASSPSTPATGAPASDSARSKLEDLFKK